MGTGTTRSQLYSPIKPYQTRIVRLHAQGDDPDSPVVCDLLVAILLDARFDGLAVRDPLSTNEYGDVTPYHALSYAWGSGQATHTILCNGLEFLVSKNLHDALQGLRPKQGESMHLWVDAICIAQDDEKEKSFQVANMYLIYRQARSVYVWLGSGNKDVTFAIGAMTSQSKDQLEHDEDFWKVYRGLEYLYTRPWFQRVWIQQEINAARAFELRCGQYRLPLNLSRLLRPRSWLTSLLPEIAGSRNPPIFCQATQRFILPQTSLPSKREKAIRNLDDLQQKRLHCFSRFARGGQLDFVETLLDTGPLNATNPLDYIYGILQMCAFPSRAVSIADWLSVRAQDVFIPIDYTATRSDVLCAVTWALLMECGLSLLIKFKTFDAESAEAVDDPLPSWVIDWRQACTFLSRSSSSRLEIRLKNTWDVVLWSDGKQKELNAGSRPSAHDQFRKDNIEAALPINELLVRGIIASRLLTKDNETHVWERREPHDEPVWDVGVELQHSDIAVWMSGAVRHHRFYTPIDWGSEEHEAFHDREFNTGLWLLRPVGNDRYKLIACLTEREEGFIACPYNHWEAETSTMPRSTRRALTPAKRMSSTSEANTYHDYKHEAFLRFAPMDTEEQVFTIV